jgi:hypothetical protein
MYIPALFFVDLSVLQAFHWTLCTRGSNFAKRVNASGPAVVTMEDKVENIILPDFTLVGAQQQGM